MTTSLSSPAPWVAIVPLGCYLLGLAWAHLRRRPLAVSGVLDGAMLAMAVSGLAIVGPLALLMPVTGGSPWSWPVLAFLFALCVAVCVLVAVRVRLGKPSRRSLVAVCRSAATMAVQVWRAAVA